VLAAAGAVLSGPVAPVTAATPTPGASVPGATSPPTSPASDATHAAVSRASALERDRLAAVRLAEQRHVTDPGHTDQPYRVESAGHATLVLPSRDEPYTLDAVRRADPVALTLDADGAWLLHEPLVVAEGATLRVAVTRPTTLRLASGAGGFTSIVVLGGRLELTGAGPQAQLTVESWDEARHALDTDVTDGRAYVLVAGSLLVRAGVFANLGFSRGRAGGLALVAPTSADVPVAGTPRVHRRARSQVSGSAGSPAHRTATAAPTAQTGTPAQTGTAAAASGRPAVPAGSGELSGVRSDRCFTGLFLRGTTGTSVRDLTVTNSASAGVSLMDTVRVTLTRVTVRSSGLDGISLRRVRGTVVSVATVTASGRHGIGVDDHADNSDDADSGASAPADYGDDRLEKITVDGSRGSGVEVTGGARIRFTASSVTTQAEGVVVTGDARAVVVQDDVVQGSLRQAVVVRSASDVVVSGNTVRASASGITLMDAHARVTGNRVTVGRGHAVELAGDLAGSAVTGNRLDGTGAAAVDLNARHAGTPTVADNDLEGWTTPRAEPGLLDRLLRPTTLAWAFIITLLLGTWPFYRRLKAVRSPFGPGSTEASMVAAIRADQARAIEQALAGRHPKPGAPAPSASPIPVAAAPPGVHPVRPRGGAASSLAPFPSPYAEISPERSPYAVPGPAASPYAAVPYGSSVGGSRSAPYEVSLPGPGTGEHPSAPDSSLRGARRAGRRP